MKKFWISCLVLIITTQGLKAATVAVVKDSVNNKCTQRVNFENTNNTYSGTLSPTQTISQVLTAGNNMSGKNQTNGYIEGMSTPNLTNGAAGGVRFDNFRQYIITNNYLQPTFRGAVLNGDVTVRGTITVDTVYATNIYVTNLWTTITNLVVYGKANIIDDLMSSNSVIARQGYLYSGGMAVLTNEPMSIIESNRAQLAEAALGIRIDTSTNSLGTIAWWNVVDFYTRAQANTNFVLLSEYIAGTNQARFYTDAATNALGNMAWQILTDFYTRTQANTNFTLYSLFVTGTNDARIKTEGATNALGNAAWSNAAWFVSLAQYNIGTSSIPLSQILTAGNNAGGLSATNFNSLQATGSIALVSGSGVMSIGTNDTSKAKLYVKGMNAEMTNNPLMLLEGSSSRNSDFIRITGNGGATNFRICKSACVIIGTAANSTYTNTFVFSGGDTYSARGASTFGVKASGGIFLEGDIITYYQDANNYVFDRTISTQYKHIISVSNNVPYTNVIALLDAGVTLPITGSTNLDGNIKSVTFETAFTYTPNVVISFAQDVGQLATVMVTNRTSTGFSYLIRNSSDIVTNGWLVNWIAK